MVTTRIKLAALWTVVMFNMTFADIIGLINPGTLEKMMNGDVGFTVTPVLLLVVSVLTAVPIVMIFLTLVLPEKSNRWVNTLAVILTAIYVAGGLTASLSYYLFMALEFVSMVAVLWYVWGRFEPHRQPAPLTE